MLFLVELDHVRTGPPPTPEAGRAFIEQVIFPTIARAEQLVAEKKIVAGGPVAGRIALRLMIEADSLEHVDRIITSIPLWTVAETRVTPLIAFSERRDHVQTLLEGLKARAT
jgi:muconolactone delta-isomerase